MKKILFVVFLAVLLIAVVAPAVSAGIPVPLPEAAIAFLSGQQITIDHVYLGPDGTWYLGTMTIRAIR